MQPQVKEIKESEIIHINPVQHNAPTNVEENARDDNVENAGRFEEIASRDPLNEDVDIGPTGTRRQVLNNWFPKFYKNVLVFLGLKTY